MEAIERYYDGYRFSPDSQLKVLNPISVGEFFSSGCRFRPYWQNTGGGSTLAVELAKRYDLITMVDEMPEIALFSFSSFDISFLVEKKLSRSNVLALLYYAGYLTIAKSDGNVISLDFPNYEIRSSFLNGLISYYTIEPDGASVEIAKGLISANKGDTESLVEYLNEYYSKFSYIDLGRDKERFVTTLFKVYLIL